MPTTKTQARKLLNASELALFEATTTTAVKNLSAAQLAIKIRRARNLRDKARDLFQRQRLATRAQTGSKRGNTGIANARTQEKAQVFAEILARLEAQADKLEARATKLAAKQAKAAAAGRKPAKKKAVAKKGAGAAKKISSGRRKAANKADRAAVKADTRSAKRAAVSGTGGKKAAATKAASKKPATKKKATANKTAAKKSGAKKAVAKKPAAKKAVAKTPAAKKSAAKKVVAKKPAAKRKAAKKPGLFGVPGLSPKATMPIGRPSDETVATARTGYVSKRAKATAKQRGFEESRLQVIQSHVSASARRNQAKRDKR